MKKVVFSIGKFYLMIEILLSYFLLFFLPKKSKSSLKKLFSFDLLRKNKRFGFFK
jgi:hypothetical protein